MKNFFKIYKSILLEKRSKKSVKSWPTDYSNLATDQYLKIVYGWSDSDLNKSEYTDEENSKKSEAENFGFKLCTKFNNVFIKENTQANRNKTLFNPIARMIAELIKKDPKKQIYNQNGDLDCKELDFIFSNLRENIINNSLLYTNEFIKKFATWTFEDFKKYINGLDITSKKIVSLNEKPEDYDVIFIDSFEQFNELFGRDETGGGDPDAIWCTAKHRMLYNKYLKNIPSLKFVILANKNWKNIKPEKNLYNEDPMDHNPYDAYGLSLVSFVININDINLKFKEACLRWNHLGNFDYAKTNIKNYGGDIAFINWDDVNAIYGFDVREFIKSKIDPKQLKEINNQIVIIKNANESVAQKLKDLNEEGQITNTIKPLRYGLTDFERKNVSELTIPKFIDIGKSFYYNKNLKKVTFENGIKIIPRGAFSNCDFLEEIKFPDDLEEIGEDAFESCEMLSDLIIPNSVKRIGAGAFAKSGITSILLPKNLSIINSYCFSLCNSLYTIKLPDSLKEIGTEAFSKCANLHSIVLPNTLKIINNYAFLFCMKFTKITIPESVERIENFAMWATINLTRIKFLGTPEFIGKQSFLTRVFTDPNFHMSTKYVKEISGPKETIDNFNILNNYLYYKDNPIWETSEDNPIKFTII